MTQFLNLVILVAPAGVTTFYSAEPFANDASHIMNTCDVMFGMVEAAGIKPRLALFNGRTNFQSKWNPWYLHEIMPGIYAASGMS